MTPQLEALNGYAHKPGGSFDSALDTAARHADQTDRDACFPQASIDALRDAGALSWLVPKRFGGDGADMAGISEAAFELARRCSASGMIFAMHQIQVAAIVRHAPDAPWFEDYLRRLVREQRLIASATSEMGIGGDLRRSKAALELAADGSSGLQFEKQASTISYGAHADDLLTTVRRDSNADASDQVLVLTHRSDMETKQLGEWDTLGMRGTCSPGFHVRARCAPEQVLPEPFATIAVETMVPVSHLLWAHVWLGLATDAFNRAQKFVREMARQNPGTTPPPALRLSELATRLAGFKALVQTALNEFMTLDADRPKLSSIGYAVRINHLKIAASEAAVEVCQGALRICGFLGYKNGGPYSVGRHLRDAHSAALMIANDRLIATNATLLLVHRETK